ncbi:DNA-directed RNA polymerase subunit beta' [Frankliniella fusca]|uniref:DNA-directed RNA polymerase subunit beta n=1 Tax=Frankliniella fusca TaxID=407009 RepID=A0AAE1HEX4_9NEOP|nr:DNA-directed RNA polymerase subunit beta' [Frankliniella fusca]
MVIGGIDLNTSKTLKKRAIREDKLAKYYSSHASSSSASSSLTVSEQVEQEDNTDNIKPDGNVFELPRWQREGSSQQMRISLKNVAAVSDRYGLSNRETAAISSAVLKDVGLVTDEDTSKVVDKCKIQRERSKFRAEQQENAATQYSGMEVQGLYFDGRIDKNTICQVKEGSKYYRRVVKEDHISIVQEPGGKYFGHVTTPSGSADDVSSAVLSHLEHSNVDMKSVKVIGTDGTSTNTGHIGGAIRLIETKLQQPVQWLICLLHFNELPLRHLVQHVDGPTSGPAGFKGPIGSSLDNCEQLPVKKFKMVTVNLPDLSFVELSKDQKYLYDICQAIGAGNCPEDLARRDPGPLSHSRWLTCANRILRLYISTYRPNTKLQTLVTFILKVYAPMWFAIKANPSCIDGTLHLWNYIVKSRYLPSKQRDVVDTVIQTNAFFAHHENILLTMLGDEQKCLRELAVRRVTNARARALGAAISDSPRQFIVPKINFQAKQYCDIIDWPEAVTEPPILRGLPTADIEACVEDAAKIRELVGLFPNHTQAVERCVKLVTMASERVCGPEARDGFIRATLLSRETMPFFGSKKDFKGIDL